MSNGPHSGPLASPPAGLLDALGGQPVIESARTAWMSAAEQGWADPTRLHHAGRRSGMLLDAARRSLAASLSATVEQPISPEEVWFAPSNRAAISAALGGTAWPNDGPLLASAVESAAVLETIERMAPRAAQSRSRQPAQPEVIGVDGAGRIDLGDLAAAVQAGASGICLQVANPEVGTRQPITAAGQLAADAHIPLVSDATGSAGRGPIPPGWTHLVVDARDWAGPPGLAALVVRANQRWTPPPGSARGWLGGPANVPAAAAAAIALELLIPSMSGECALASALIGRIREAAASVPDVLVVGDAHDRLPHVVTFSVLYAAGEALVHAFDQRGFAVASGSACVSDEDRPSHVLAAMGAYTGGNIRISLPIGVHPATVDGFLAALPEVVDAVRAEAGGR